MDSTGGRARRIFRYTPWDAVPAVLALVHLVLLAGFLDRRSWRIPVARRSAGASVN